MWLGGVVWGMPSGRGVLWCYVSLASVIRSCVGVNNDDFLDILHDLFTNNSVDINNSIVVYRHTCMCLLVVLISYVIA